MIGIGVIGYGYWGPNLVRNFAECQGAAVRMVCDLRPAQLENPAIVDQYTDLMSDEERERGARMLVEGARQLHLLARALQHELDHLDGKMFVDLVEDKLTLDKELAEMRLRLAQEKAEASIGA